MKDLLPAWSNLVFTQLISYGVQLGHSLNNSLSICAWMIKGKRQSIFLIDLFKFSYMLRAGLYVLEAAVRGRKPVWFVNLDKASSLFVKFPALECGEYWVTENWIKGMISNYFVVKKSFLKNVNRSFAVWNRKFFLKNSNFSHWGFTRYTWPRFVFVSNVFRSYGPCHEAHRLNIPALGVVDTNTPHNLVSIALPGNDESASALMFYNSFISTFVLYMKYSFIHSWYINCLNENVFSFENWWQSRSVNINKIIRPTTLSLNFDQLRYMLSGFQSQFLQDSWQMKKLENLSTIYKKKQFIVSTFHLKYFYNKKVKLLRALTKSWVLSSFFLKFFKSSSRKLLLAKKNRSYQSKYNLTKSNNLYYFLMPFKLSQRLFFKKVSRRLAKSLMARKAKRFFYSFYSLAALFSLFKRTPLFSRRMNKKTNYKLFYHRGGIRFYNYLYRNFLAPSNYSRVFLRYLKHKKYTLRRDRLNNLRVCYPTAGWRKSNFQFSLKWFKSLYLLRYGSALGMPLNKVRNFLTNSNFFSIPVNNLFVNGGDLEGTYINKLTNWQELAYGMDFWQTQLFSSYKGWYFNRPKNYSGKKWFLQGKLRFKYALAADHFSPYRLSARIHAKKLFMAKLGYRHITRASQKNLYYYYA